MSTRSSVSDDNDDDENHGEKMPPKFHLPRWQSSREIGLKKAHDSLLLPHLYKNMRKFSSFLPIDTVKHQSHGGIFNFDFSTDGCILVAACERKSFLLFDPLSGKMIGAKTNAHNDCVNCIRFLDCRTFATCSDDTTVTLWDARYLRQSLRTLSGHSNWVKNIEYDYKRGLLLTSGFDGSIYTWEINNYSSSGDVCERVFHTSGLMRSKLSPDASKLIISTAGGYIMIIHDLDLAKLSRDLRGFKPNMYRLMQMAQSPRRLVSLYNHVFRRKRNRVEFISDFPAGDDAEVMSSLQVHPQGWSVVSRNTSSDENSEWTCAHDIQQYPHSLDQNDDLEAETTRLDSSTEYQSRASSPASVLSVDEDESWLTAASVDAAVTMTLFSPDNTTEETDTPLIDNGGGATEILGAPGIEGATEVQAPSTAQSSHPGHVTRSRTNSAVVDTDSNQSSRTSHHVTSINHQPSRTTSRKPRPQTSNNRIYKNRPRLLCHIEEPNVGRGFIKEMCYSSDGRLVCSPFGYGTRLLALDSRCSELCDVVPNVAQTFHEFQSCMSHKNVVLCTKFSPTHCLFVSGCLNGEVMFHQPVL